MSAIDGGAVLVTGASAGIGREIALQLGPRARALVLVARRADRLAELAAELRARHPTLLVRAETCDIGDLAAVARLLDTVAREVGPIDVLVNNAGMGDIALLERSDWNKLDQMIRLNVVALTYLTRRLVGPMVERGRGGILNVGSGMGLVWIPGMAVYSATKHYVDAFSESLRGELRGTGVVVTHVCPGPVATEFEAVAGNPTGIPVPGFVQISAVRCARAAIRALDRRRALTLPGFLIGLLTRAGTWAPRPLVRFVYSPIGRFLRARG